MTQCGSVMVGSGTDTYDPICELPAGHSGPCKSTAAVDQHRLDEIPHARICTVPDCPDCALFDPPAP